MKENKLEEMRTLIEKLQIASSAYYNKQPIMNNYEYDLKCKQLIALEKETGITIHYINEHYDEGDTIFRATCPVLPTDSPGDVAEKVHALEYEHFPRVIEQIITTL